MKNDEQKKHENAITGLIKAQEELEHRERLLKSLNETAAILIANDMRQPMDMIRKCMEIIGAYMKIDRINIWKSIEIEGTLQYYRDFGWENEETRKNIPLEKTMSTYPFMKMNKGWYDTLRDGRVVNAIASDLPPLVYERLKPVGVLSLLFVPVYMQGEYWGYVSYDDCHEASLFSDEEVDILRSSSLLMASALARSEMMEQLIMAREEALLGAKAKTDFLANMSHEIRTPLNAVIGMTSIGKNATSTDRKDYCFGKIEDASKHLLGVINDVLDMSKIEANKFELSEVDFEFEKMLQNVVSVASFRIEEKKQHFMVYIDDAIPESLMGDDQRLAQITSNLLANAVKFTPEGGSISINTYLVASDGDLYTIQFEVNDTGIGISEEQKSRLFDNFQQADSATSRTFGGTGLGLAISKRIVEMMGGKIWIESEIGKGSSFRFTVTLRKTSEREKRRKLGDGVTPRNLHALFVDDDSAICEYFTDIASRLGFECDIANSGKQALSRIENNPPYDIFFIDWKMPDMDGLELSERIREVAGSRSIITMISSYELAEFEDKAKDIGVDRFLPKPLFPSAIADLIAECLSDKTKGEGHEQSKENDNFNGARILLAEDVEINREIVIALLEPLSLIIDCAENGKQAFEKYSADPFSYDLILMDVQMPEMNGYETTRKIRALEFDRAREIPIIAMTANVFKQDIEQCIASGMNDHLGKPLDMEDLVAMLRKHIKKSPGPS